jgi:hypothetical protein
MLSNGDQYLFADSMQDKKIKYPILRKRIIYQNDGNNNNYNSNTLNFDLSQFANVNSGELLDFSGGEMQLPIVYTIQGPSNVNGPTEGMFDYRLGPKNGAWNLIHSASIQYGNREVLSPSASYLNAIINFRCLTTWSLSDIRQYGSQCLYALDSPNSWQWNYYDVAATSTNLSRTLGGNGLVNNMILPTYTDADTVSVPAPIATVNKFLLKSSTADVQFGNRGLLDRMRMINNKVPTVQAYDTGIFEQNVDYVRGPNQYNAELKNYTSQIFNAGGNSTYQYYFCLASIPLKFISPFFEALPLCRSAYVKMQLTLNCGYVVISNPDISGAAGGGTNTTAAQSCTSSNIGFQFTTPIMVAARLLNVNHVNTCTSLLATANLVTPFSCNVANFTNPATLINVKHPLGSARISVCAYELNPDDAAEYLAANTAKTIEWESYYTNVLTNVSSGNMCDQMISNGTNGVTGVLVIPWVSGSVNGSLDPITLATTNAATSPFAEPRSPFSASPAQPSPAASYLNAQVFVGGRNLLGDVPINYNHEHFMMNIREIGAINGRNLTGLCVADSLSLKCWSDGYRYLYAVNRDVDSKANVSVQVKFVNNSLLAHDYLFVIFRKQSMTINVANGQVIE